MPDTGGNTDSGDSSSDEGMFTPTSTDSSPDEMAHADSSPLLASAAPMARDEGPTNTPSFAAPIPATANKGPGNLILDWEDAPEEGQGGAATPRPRAPPPPGLIPPYPLYPVVPITADQAGMVDDLMSGPPGTPGPFSGHTPNFNLPYTTYTTPANSSGQSPWNTFANANANSQPAWSVDDGADDIELGIFESRAQRQRELLEMQQIEAAIAVSRADMPDFIACSNEQERVMMAYAEDSSIPRPRRESKEDEEFFSELLPTEIDAEDEDIEDAIGNLDLEEQDGNDDEEMT